MIQKYIFCVWGRSGPLTQIKFSVYQWLDNMLVYEKLSLHSVLLLKTATNSSKNEVQMSNSPCTYSRGLSAETRWFLSSENVLGVGII